MNCQVNEKRVFSNQDVKDRLKELGVKLIVADMSNNETSQPVKTDLSRADRKTIPVNLIYPSNYPQEPAILLEDLISPGEALEALRRAEASSKKMLAPPTP